TAGGSAASDSERVSAVWDQLEAALTWIFSVRRHPVTAAGSGTWRAALTARPRLSGGRVYLRQLILMLGSGRAASSSWCSSDDLRFLFGAATVRLPPRSGVAARRSRRRSLCARQGCCRGRGCPLLSGWPAGAVQPG